MVSSMGFPWNSESLSGKALDYFVLDVFTSRRLEGNALAVMLHDGSLDDAMMQAIARETNLSETTFVDMPSLARSMAQTEEREGVRVRIFTTEEELPFAGHPTLGTASLLRAIAPECMRDGVVTLALNVGPVPVRFEESTEAWPARGEMTQRDPEFGEELDADEVAALTGLEREDFHPRSPIQIVSTGTAFAIVPLRSTNALARLRVRHEEASAYLRARGARWFYVLGPEDGQGNRGASGGGAGSLEWRARMQFNGGEDPATGSAAGCAISYLVRHDLVAPDAMLHLRQGIEMERPSDLYLRAALEGEKVRRVRVGGSTILVAKGQLFLP